MVLNCSLGHAKEWTVLAVDVVRKQALEPSDAVTTKPILSPPVWRMISTAKLLRICVRITSGREPSLRQRSRIVEVIDEFAEGPALISSVASGF
jgi:hypothetical protein